MKSNKPPIEETLSDSQKEIITVCDGIRDMLVEKNRKYGDSALHPTRIFSRVSAVEQINVRIDDKLSRKLSSQGDEDEDIEQDLIGYLVLKRVALNLQDEVELTLDLDGGS